jgi:putative transposase
MKVKFVDSQRDTHGVQPVLEARPKSARAAWDREWATRIEQVYEDNYGVYGRARCAPS